MLSSLSLYVAFVLDMFVHSVFFCYHSIFSCHYPVSFFTSPSACCLLRFSVLCFLWAVCAGRAAGQMVRWGWCQRSASVTRRMCSISLYQPMNEVHYTPVRVYGSTRCFWHELRLRSQCLGSTTVYSHVTKTRPFLFTLMHWPDTFIQASPSDRCE